LLKAKWWVSAAGAAISAIEWSPIKPTMMMSGSCRIGARRSSAEHRPSAASTWVWFSAGWISSTGSSIVRLSTSPVAGLAQRSLTGKQALA
jgi:hypothetical protein